MKTKDKTIDLVAYLNGKKIAFEIETGKNSRKQIQQNIEKCLNAGVDKVYVVAVNKRANLKVCGAELMFAALINEAINTIYQELHDR